MSTSHHHRSLRGEVSGVVATGPGGVDVTEVCRTFDDGTGETRFLFCCHPCEAIASFDSEAAAVAHLDEHVASTGHVAHLTVVE